MLTWVWLHLMLTFARVETVQITGFRSCSSLGSSNFWTSSFTCPLSCSSSTKRSISLLCFAMKFRMCIDGYDVPVIMRGQRSGPHLADCLRTQLGVQIVPASGSSSELSSHQKAIRNLSGVQKMPASSWQRSESYAFLRRYGRRSGQPSSSSLARRACVHVLPFRWYCCSCAVRRH